MTLNEQLPKIPGLAKIPTGEKIIKGLGLSQFDRAVIQKIINMSIPVFVITLDSRFPNREITTSRLKKLESTRLFKAKKFSDIIEPKRTICTPPVHLTDFTGDIPSDALMVQRDLAGEYFNNSSMFEKEIDGKKIRVFG